MNKDLSLCLGIVSVLLVNQKGSQSSLNLLINFLEFVRA